MRSHRQEYRRPVLVGIILTMFLLSVVCVSAQLSGGKNGKKRKADAIQRLQSRFGLSSREFQELSPFIQEEMRELQTVYTKYNDQDGENFMLAWRAPGIWYKLMSGRTELEAEMKGKFTKAQADALRAACSKMEDQMLSLLLEDQLALLASELDLRGGQIDEINEVIVVSNDKKQKLIADPQIQANGDLFRLKLDFVSKKTDEDIAKILTAQQLYEYEVLKQKANEDLSRIWA